MSSTVDLAPLVPPRIGLIATAQEQGGLDDRWSGGIHFAANTCLAPSDIPATDPCAVDTATFTGVSDDGDVTAIPALFRVPVSCSAQSGVDDIEAKASAAYRAAEEFMLTREFYGGTQSTEAGWGNVFLNDAAVPVIDAGDHGPIDTLGHIAQYVAANVPVWRRPWIHVPYRAMPWLTQTGAVRREGATFLTDLDMIVVPGLGYDYAGAEQVAKIVVTGPVTLARSDVEVLTDEGGTLLRSKNTRNVIAQGYGATVVDSCLIAQISMKLCRDALCS